MSGCIYGGNRERVSGCIYGGNRESEWVYIWREQVTFDAMMMMISALY